LDLNRYLTARDLVTNIGQPIMLLVVILSALLLIVSFQKNLRSYSRHIILGISLFLGSGYALLIWFHYQIYKFLPLIYPQDGSLAGRYAIPVWIEDEKLFFWTFLTSIWLLFIKTKKASYQITLNVVIVIFIFLTATTSNPFFSPLKDFHREIGSIYQALSLSNVSVQMQIFGPAIGRLQGFYNSTYMWIHPPLLFIAYSTFVISFVNVIFMLVKKSASHEKAAYNWAKPGYIALTLGLLLGYPWAFDAWKGQPWWFSPKINVTLMMWVLYTAYLHSRIYIHKKGMWVTTGIIGILGFVGVVATYLSTYVLPGIHSVGG